MNLSDTELKVLNKIKDLLANNTVCIGFETIVVSTSSIALVSIPVGATDVIIQVESTVATDRVRYREDGNAPTSTIGKFKTHGDEFELLSQQSIQQFRAIKDSAATGTTQLNVSYYK